MTKTKRKSPIRHKVKAHTRKGRRVRQYIRGRGNNPPKSLTKKIVVTRFGVKRFGELPLHKNFYIVTGLADPKDDRSRFRLRAVGTDPKEAKNIMRTVLQEEFGVGKAYNVEVWVPKPVFVKRGKRLGIPKDWFDVMSPLPLYLVDKDTGLVKEFHQGITYRPGDRPR